MHPGKRLDNDYSGNTVDLCPVGALTLKDFRFQNRVWFLEHTPTICAGCSRGCNVLVGCGTKNREMTSGGQLDDRIKRLVPRVNEEVNGHWMCDEGRLTYHRVENAERLMTAEAAGAGCEWDDAVAQAGEALKQAGAAGKAGAVLSPRLTSETMFGLKLLFDTVGGVKVGTRQLIQGEDDELLIRADKGANARGAEWILGSGDEAAVLDAIRSGAIDTLLITADPLDPADTVALPDDIQSKLKLVIYIGAFAASVTSGQDHAAGLHLPGPRRTAAGSTWTDACSWCSGPTVHVASARCRRRREGPGRSRRGGLPRDQPRRLRGDDAGHRRALDDRWPVRWIVRRGVRLDRTGVEV